MNKLQELMVITMEECGELTQTCSKVIRKFENFEDIDHEKLDNLIEEIGDVACMIELMVESGICTETQIQDRILLKREKLKKRSKLFE